MIQFEYLLVEWMDTFIRPCCSPGMYILTSFHLFKQILINSITRIIVFFTVTSLANFQCQYTSISLLNRDFHTVGWKMTHG